MDEMLRSAEGDGSLDALVDAVAARDLDPQAAAEKLIESGRASKTSRP
jgi:hypothetical protein